MEKEVTIAENTPAAGTSCLSSNATLFWRVFVPVFGTVFWTGILLGTWLTDGEDLYMPFVPMLTMRVVFLLLWAGWLYYVYRALWPLKRIDADTTHLYLTNYWTTVRYRWEDVERIEQKRSMGRRVSYLWLKAPGRFGQKLVFLPASHFDEWMSTHAKAGLMSES